MGRKPNPLILEFFERGPKLEDQSNRYVHTCKRCFMLFPKGRADSMTRHILSKCPHTTDYDKARVFAYIQGNSDLSQFGNMGGMQGAMSQPTQQLDQNVGTDQAAMGEQAAGINAGLNREPSALDTLAEVSRQHLDLSRQRQSDAGAPHDPALDSQEMDSWMLQLQQQLAAHNDAEDSRAQRLMQHHTDANPLIETASAAAQLSASLEDAASSMPDARDRTGMMATARAQHVNLDPALQALQNGHRQPTPPPRSHHKATPAVAPDAPATGPALGFQGYGLFGLERPNKRQRRNKFSAERRKEVGGIRKMGACLRCRMLKKPCSGETPCATCSIIGAPRVWRAACIRTRVADEFTLYNTSYFYAKARDKQLRLCGAMPADKPTQQIHVALLNGEDARTSTLAFPTLKCPALASHDPLGATDGDAVSIHLLQVEQQEATKTVEGYLEMQYGHFVESEPDQFLKVTLQTLKSLDTDGKDALVSRTLLLWAATTILVSPTSLSWVMALSDIPSDISNAPLATPLDPSSAELDLLQSQVLDAIERFSSQAIKQVCNELERRLLARTTSTSMITYLVTFTLLNCVERMSLLFRSFDPRPLTLSPDDPIPPADDDDGSPPDWPLKSPPSTYVAQGPAFAHLLSLLLRMRSLPPRTAMNPLNPDSLDVVRRTAHSWEAVPPRDDLLPPPQGQDVPLDTLMATWLARAAPSWSWLVAQAGRSDDDTQSAQGGPEGPRAWDGRFVAGLVCEGGWDEAM